MVDWCIRWIMVAMVSAGLAVACQSTPPPLDPDDTSSTHATMSSGPNDSSGQGDPVADGTAADGSDDGLDSGGNDDGSDSGEIPDDGGAACLAMVTDRGGDPLCGSCSCGRCRAPTEECFADQSCAQVVACAQLNCCRGLDCYCGGPLAAGLCGLSPQGPCVEEMEQAAGATGMNTIRDLLDGTEPGHPLANAQALLECTRGTAGLLGGEPGVCQSECGCPTEDCTFESLSCQDRECSFDAQREIERELSSMETSIPVIESIEVDSQLVWTLGANQAPLLPAGSLVTLHGHGFGAGPEIDFTKLMIGNARVLESDLAMYEQELNIFTQVHHETPQTHSQWARDIQQWHDDEITFTVPRHAVDGELRIQIQKRSAPNESLFRPQSAHDVVDALTSRIIDPSFPHACDVVSGLEQMEGSDPIFVRVHNPEFEALVTHGREIFWAYDYNIGTAHAVRNLDWVAILDGILPDPIAGGLANPLTLFGAYPTVAGEVPPEAILPVYFAPYPQPSPIPGLLGLGSQRFEGNTQNSGFVGYRYAESSHPFQGNGEWIGFNCASCHGYRISYAQAPGEIVTRVIPGLPNPRWSMKWAALGDFEGVVADEEGPLWDRGSEAIDKRSLLYAMPQGVGEHNVVRQVGEGSHTDNDYQFSPIAIPNVTHYLPIRRSLSHTESYVGFEGSYIHSEEPDGALGSMAAPDLQALTAYMSTLDEYDDDLRNVGLYRWLDFRGLRPAELNGVSEGEFVQAQWSSFPALVATVDHGKTIFDQHCGSCHTDTLGAHTNEQMIPLTEVGRFFSPTIYQKEMQSIRVNYLRDLYWTQHRGLLSDGHVRNLEDLVHPDRCQVGSELYNRYYTLHEPTALEPAGPDFPPMIPATYVRGDVFRIAKGTPEQNRFVERHPYFVDVPWDPDHYYWDYQQMRAKYGPWEMGTAGAIGLPATPHPWCIDDPHDIDALVHYLLTL